MQARASANRLVKNLASSAQQRRNVPLRGIEQMARGPRTDSAVVDDASEVTAPERLCLGWTDDPGRRAKEWTMG